MTPPNEVTVLRRAPLFLTSLGFALGCWLGTIPLQLPTSSPQIIIYVAAWIVLGIFYLSWWKGSERIRFTGLAGAVILGGWLYGWGQQLWLRPDDIRWLVPALQDPAEAWRGKIDSLPDPRGATVQFYLQLQSVQSSGTVQSATGRVLIRLHQAPPHPELAYGQTVAVPGIPEQPMTARNPGQLDYRRYLSDHGVYYTLGADYSAVQMLAPGSRWSLINWAGKARDWAGRQLTLGLTNDPTVSAILSGMLFGYIEDIPPDIDNAFRVTGTYHIFAVSGQNLAELLGLGILFLQVVGLTRWRWGWMVAPALVFYCLVSENQPSIIRALIMGLLVLLAWRIGRPVSPLNLWAVTLLLVLVDDPRSIRDLGFLLSFAVVLSLLLLAGPLVRWWQSPWKLDPFIPRRLAPPRLLWREATGKGASALVGTSLAAWLGSVPLMWLFFHQVSLVAILANLFVVPLAGLIVVIGTLSVLAATASTTLTLLLNNANWLAVKVMLAGVLSMAHWPGASTYVADFSAWDSLHAPHVTIAQASTAQVMVLRYRGQNWLINPGSANDYRYLVDPLRKFYGINHWDGVILSEFSTSAIGGASNLAHETSVSHWWIPPGLPHSARLQALLQGLPTEIITRGFQHQLDADCRLSVVSPSPDDDYSRAADGELVLLLEYKGQRLLYAGSIGFGVEQHLVRSGQALPVHFLVQGYHPEEPSLSPMWLLALSPAYIIRAAPPRFQHGKVSEILPESDLAGHPLILDQAKTGAVEIKLEEGKSVVKPFLHS